MPFWTAVNRRRTWVLDGIRTRLWPVPAMAIVIAIVIGALLPELDEALDGAMPAELSRWIFGGGPAAAREVLAAIAASVMTVTSLTFSLTLVTLQLASGQFSPRLLRTFAQDKFVQRTLGLFVATFAYALTVLRTVRDSDNGGTVFVPQISVTVGYLLAVISVIALVLFLAHLVRQIRVETLLGSVLDEALRNAETSLEQMDESAQDDAAPAPPPGAYPVGAPSTGFLTGVNQQPLVDAAAGAGAVVALSRKPGDWVVAGTPVAMVWAGPGGGLDDDAVEELRTCVAKVIHIGEERTPVQDIGYAIRQLTDVVVKALSPGINDPTTAVHGIGHLSALLCRLADRRLGAAVCRDDDGVARVVVQGPELADLLDEAVTQPRHYGVEDAAVLAALTRLLRDLAWCAGTRHEQAITSQLARMRRTVAGQDFDPAERESLEQLALAVEEALAGRWRSPEPA
ncbi:MAG: DUF2254 domain-containing protein [Actinomycetota bacterium]|nr:DUF2254 domain-containing protein [Actinomycetota bacterium]